MAGDSDGDQAIHTAAHFGNLQCLKLLVEVLGNQAAFARKGAGHTPFELAVLQDMQQAAAWLKASVTGDGHTRPGAMVMWQGPGSSLSGKAARIEELHETRLREQGGRR